MPTHIHIPPADSTPVQTPAVGRPRRERKTAVRPVVRPIHRWYPPCKYTVDFVAALALGLLALPVIALSALAVKLTSRGPAFYTQKRVGRSGRLFTIYKVRSMVHNCESLTGPRWSIPGDPRVTRVGWFLRITHLDELPQLLNVLRGDMSLIGPRPERPEFTPELERSLPAYSQRLTVRPGVTGLAQVQLPADTDLHSVRRKLAHDLFYVWHVNPWLDLRLLICTVFYAAGVPFSLLSRVLRVPRGDAIEQAMQGVLSEPAPGRARIAA